MAKPKDVVKQIRKTTRRKFSAEEKIRIVLEGLRGEAIGNVAPDDVGRMAKQTPAGCDRVSQGREQDLTGKNGKKRIIFNDNQ